MLWKSVLGLHKTYYRMLREETRGEEGDRFRGFGEEQLWENRGVRGQTELVACKQWPVWPCPHRGRRGPRVGGASLGRVRVGVPAAGLDRGPEGACAWGPVTGETPVSDSKCQPQVGPGPEPVRLQGSTGSQCGRVSECASAGEGLAG